MVKCFCILFAALVMGNSGCQFAPTVSAAKWPWSKKTPPIPDRMLTIWSDSVLHQQGLPGVRGFGGRVYFYQAPSTDPIQIDGGVAVYVFDANDVAPKDQKPIRKYVFTADQMAQHMSKSSLGPSYSLWLPWDEVGGESRRLSLITRFEGREGGTLISDPSVKLLPGVIRSDESSPSDRPLAARSVGHQKHFREPVVTSEQIGGRGIDTIDLPPSFQKHLKGNVSNDQNSSQQTPQLPSPKLTLPPSDLRNSTQPVLPASATMNTQTAPSPNKDNSTGSGEFTTQVRDLRSAPARTNRSQRDIREGQSIQSPR